MVEAVEFLPIVIAPQDSGAELLSGCQNALHRIVGTDRYPYASLTPVPAEAAWIGAGRRRKRSRVLCIEDPDMKVADLARRTVGIEKLLSRYHAMEYARDS